MSSRFLNGKLGTKKTSVVVPKAAVSAPAPVVVEKPVPVAAV